MAGPLTAPGGLPPVAGDPRWARHTAWLVAALFFVRLGVALSVQLAPDEAYYWVWSQRLAAGYFDHPPAVAWLLAVTTGLFGNNVFGVRIAALLCSVATAAAVYGLGVDLFRDRRAGFLAVGVASTLPLLSAGALVITPDTPQGVAWILAAWFLWRATTWNQGRLWWLATGVAVGFALLSKYVAVFFGVFALAWVLLDRPSRRVLLTPWPYLGALVGGGLFVPVVLWNARHEWVSFLFQLGHGLSSRRGGPLSVGEYVGGQLLLVTPVFAVLLALTSWWAYRWVRGRRSCSPEDGGANPVPIERVWLFLACWALPVLGVFVVSAWRGPTEANWPSPAHLAVALAVGGLWSHGARVGWVGLKRACAVGVAIAGFATGALHVYLAQPFFEWPGDRARQRISGWQELAAVVQAEVDRLPADRVWVVTDSYQFASELAFYGPGVELVAVWPETGRRSQYDVWGAPEIKGGDAAVYVATGERAVPAGMRALFGRVGWPMEVPIPGVNSKGNQRSVTIFGLQDYLGALGGAPGSTEDRG